MIEEKKKGNICGIIGLSISWIIPIAGFILGIISLNKKEDSKALGILAIIMSVIFWIIYITILIEG